MGVRGKRIWSPAVKFGDKTSGESMRLSIRFPGKILLSGTISLKIGGKYGLTCLPVQKAVKAGNVRLCNFWNEMLGSLHFIPQVTL